MFAQTHWKIETRQGVKPSVAIVCYGANQCEIFRITVAYNPSFEDGRSGDACAEVVKIVTSATAGGLFLFDGHRMVKSLRFDCPQMERIRADIRFAGVLFETRDRTGAHIETPLNFERLYLLGDGRGVYFDDARKADAAALLNSRR